MGMSKIALVLLTVIVACCGLIYGVVSLYLELESERSKPTPLAEVQIQQDPEQEQRITELNASLVAALSEQERLAREISNLTDSSTVLQEEARDRTTQISFLIPI